MRMRQIMLGATLCTAVLQAPAQEPSLYQIAADCTQWAEANICQGKAGCPSWEWVATCLVEQESGRPGKMAPDVKARFDWCISAIERQRARQHLARTQGDPLGDTMACLSGAPPNAK